MKTKQQRTETSLSALTDKLANRKVQSVSAGLILAAAVVSLLWPAAPTLRASPPSHGPANLNPRLVPPVAKIQGKTYAEWGVSWWRWAYSIPLDQNPNFESSGVFDAVGQAGPVWFVPITAAFGGVKERHVNVPLGKFVFVPLAVGALSYPCAADPNFQPAPGQSVEEFLASILTPIVDAVTDLTRSGLMTAEVDGVPVQNLADYRTKSGLFLLTGDPSLAAWDSCVTGGAQPTLSDGFWLMLPPLSRGEHTVHYKIVADFLPDGGQEVTFHISVEPEIAPGWAEGRCGRTSPRVHTKTRP
jgi:hypothetical protein